LQTRMVDLEAVFTALLPRPHKPLLEGIQAMYCPSLERSRSESKILR
jgi:hypothetical protein